MQIFESSIKDLDQNNNNNNNKFGETIWELYYKVYNNSKKKLVAYNRANN